jgi:anti-sigma factor RsiW
MQCTRRHEDELSEQKMELLYGEADPEVRARVEAHLGECLACRDEMAGLAQVRRKLQAWTLDSPRRGGVRVPPGRHIPLWLGAAAGLLLGLGAGVGFASLGDAAVRRDLAAQETRALEREQEYRQEISGLRAALERRASAPGAQEILARVDDRVTTALDARLGAQDRKLEEAFAEWSGQVEAQRRVDMARVAAGLSYLDGQHGQQVARTNELMSYVLDAAGEGPRQ